MPKTVKAKQVGTSAINEVPVTLFQLDAKTKDSKGVETKFTYEFPKFADDVSLSDLVKALTYTNSKKEVITGESVLRDYANTAIKNEKRSAKLASINTVLKLREDPEKAFQDMVSQLVVGFGVPREIAEANVRAMLSQGNLSPANEASA